jgi:hypothetical protein
MHLIADSTQRRAYSLAEAAAICGRHYQSLYRAACRGDLKVLTGFGRMMISDQELNRFLGRSEIYRPTRKQTRAVAPDTATLALEG